MHAAGFTDDELAGYRVGVIAAGVDMAARCAAFALMLYITYSRYTLIGATVLSAGTVAISQLPGRVHGWLDRSFTSRVVELCTAILSALSLTILLGVATEPYSVLGSMLVASCVCFLANTRLSAYPRTRAGRK